MVKNHQEETARREYFFLMLLLETVVGSFGYRSWRAF
jgi:hypothetical protein